ncbi:protoglobin domain-containing protein [Viridibacillus arvi]|uniref:protoglobin domain-containing protein n=1 Tax=Viridibacillus arvi TaxID=263475 RepID=UPI0034CEF5A1
MFFLKDAKESIIGQGKGMMLNVSEKDIQRQIKMIGLTIKDLDNINSVKPFVDKEMDTIIEIFYNTLVEEPSLVNIINSNSSIERLKGTLRKHISEMFDGVINQEYVRKRYKIAYIHAKIGLKSKWYMCAFQNLLASLNQIVYDNVPIEKEAFMINQSLTKLLNLEQQIVLETYDEQIEKKKEEIRERSIQLGEEVITSSEDLAAVSEQTKIAFQELNSYAKEMLQLSNEGMNLSVISAEKAQEGKEKLQEHNEQMNYINSAVHLISNEFKGLHSMLEEMGQIINIVTGIADQTNLLSLNASIEAARAGEYGRGFSVVAQEVRKLSDETKNSVSNITSLISNTQSQMHVVTNRLKSIVSNVEDGGKTMKDADYQFQEIVTLAAETKNQTNEIKSKLSQFVSIIKETGISFERVSHSADELTVISRKVFEHE